MADIIFKRKIYSKLKEWKETSKGKTALLLEGARRIGKSTIVEEFAQKEYRSYILIDFNEASKGVKGLFDDLIFYCVRTTVVSRYSAYREDMISRRGSWRTCLASHISKKAARFRCRAVKAATGTA